MKLLAQLQGRPANFYRHFLAHFVRALQRGAHADDFPNLLELRLQQAWERIVAKGRKLMDQLWDSYAAPTRPLAQSSTPGKLIAKLYFAIKMKDGQLTFTDREGEKLARYGVGFCCIHRAK